MKIRFSLSLALLAGLSFLACGTAGQEEEIAGSKGKAGRQEEIAGSRDILDRGAPTLGDIESHATTTSGSCDGTGECGDMMSGCMGCALSGACAGTMDDCMTSTECNDFLSCAGACSDSMCQEDCMAQEPEGAALYEAVVVCIMVDECPGDCGSPGPGSGGDPGGPPGSCDNTGECGDSTSGCIECAVHGECAGQRLACQNENQCLDYLICLDQCTTSACMDACVAQEPEGAALYQALVECVACGACANDCAADLGEACL